MNVSADGQEDQNRRTWREESEVPVHADSNDLRETGQASTADGSEQKRGTRTTVKEAHSEQGEDGFGKILSQLRKLREEHLKYVNAHTERLKERLAEDEEHRQQLISEMDELEQEIILQLRGNEQENELEPEPEVETQP
jgi:hypothetical protein